MKNKINLNNDGSVLVLLVIIIAVIIVLGGSLMSITLMNYKIKKANTEIKQSFYMSETGLNKAYVNAHELIAVVVNDSILKAEDFLIVNPADEVGAVSVFKDNYKSAIVSGIADSLSDNSNPMVYITNQGALYFIGDKLIVSIESKHVSTNNIEKTTSVDLIILVPDYYEVNEEITDYSAYLSFDNYNIVN